MSELEKAAPKIQRIGKYDIIDELGHGGMGVVYRGIDKQIGREVAIKTLTQAFMSEPKAAARFIEEGQRTGRLKHPNIVTVYEVGEDNGMPYIVMECVEGDPLDRLLRARARQFGASESGTGTAGALGTGERMLMSDRLRIIEDVCSALGYAHRNNVIHRDVKPANIYVQPDGNVKLLDFGIARLEKRGDAMGHTRTGSVIGTVPYMAPERLLNGIVDARSDIFSAGVVLYQLITDQLPFAGEEYVLMQRILNDPHPPLSSCMQGYPAGLDAILDRALAKDPDERYPTAEEMAADLNGVIEELKQEQVYKLLPEARQLMEAQEFTRARAVLQQLLKIQSKNAEARELLGEIQRHFALRQREDRILQICRQAEESLSEARFDEGLAFLKEGIELYGSDVHLVQLRDKVLLEKDKQERISGYLRDADIARRKGDYKSAVEAAEKAYETDQTNSRILALCKLLRKEADDAHKRETAASKLDEARRELSERRYSQALVLLREVEELDPSNPELPLLVGDANQGLEQVARREAILKLEDQVAIATSYVQLQQAGKSIQDAMTQMPAEAALFRLSAEVERQIKEYEERRIVEDTVMACRDLRPREALELVSEARTRLPGNQRLISLEMMLDQRVRQQSIDQRCDEYLQRGREALRGERFVEAIRILEMAQSEEIASDEIVSLLDFARGEQSERSRLSILNASLSQAQILMREGDWQKVILFLEEKIEEGDDPALRLLLEQAFAGRELVKRQVETALALASKLAETKRDGEAISLLERQPRAVLVSDRVQVALTLLRDQMQDAPYRAVGRAYCLSESDLLAGDWEMRQLVAVEDVPETITRISELFNGRTRTTVDRTLEDVTARCRLLMRERDKAGASELAESVAGIVSLASPQVNAEWQQVVTAIAKPSLMKRLRR